MSPTVSVGLFLLFAYAAGHGAVFIRQMSTLIREASNAGDTVDLLPGFRAVRALGWVAVVVGLAGCALVIAAG